MLSDGRQDQLLRKLQECVGRIQPKGYQINTKKEIPSKYTTDRRKSFDHRNTFKGQDRFNQNIPSQTKKEYQYDRGSKYGNQKRRQRQSYGQKWQLRKNNDNYFKEVENSSRKPSKYDNCFTNRKNYENRNQFDNRQILGNLNSFTNIQKPCLVNQKYEKYQKPSYQNYKSFKTNQKQTNYDIKPQEIQESYRHKQLINNKEYDLRSLKKNYDQSGFQKSQHIKVSENLEKSRKQQIFERKQIKNQLSNDNILIPQPLQSSIRRYQRNSFSAMRSQRQSLDMKQSILKKNLKNIGSIAVQKKFKQRTSELNHSLNHQFSSKNFQFMEKSRALERSRKLQNISRESSVRKELQQVSTNNNQDTLSKLKKIGELNGRINERIKKIIQTFEQPLQY